MIFIPIFATVLALALPVLIVIFFYKKGKKKSFGSFVKQNTIEFWDAGEAAYKILPNTKRVLTRPFVKAADGSLVLDAYSKPIRVKIEEYRLEHISVAKPEEIVRVNEFSHWLRLQWGYYWGSVWQGPRHHRTFNITKARLKDRTALPENSPLSAMIEMDSEPVKVDYLLEVFPRPFLFIDIEDINGWIVNLLVSGIFEVVIPGRIAYVFQERFFEQLMSVISGAVQDFMRRQSYEDFLKIDTGKGSEFTKFIKSRLVTSNTYSIIETLGVDINDIWVEAQQLVGRKEEQDAIRKKEINTLLGDADIALADREKTAAEHRAKANTALMDQERSVYAAARTNGVLESLNRDRVARHLGNGNLRVLSQGGAGIITSVPLNESDPVPPANPAGGTPAPTAVTTAAPATTTI